MSWFTAGSEGPRILVVALLAAAGLAVGIGGYALGRMASDPPGSAQGPAVSGMTMPPAPKEASAPTPGGSRAVGAPAGSTDDPSWIPPVVRIRDRPTPGAPGQVPPSHPQGLATGGVPPGPMVVGERGRFPGSVSTEASLPEPAPLRIPAPPDGAVLQIRNTTERIVHLSLEQPGRPKENRTISIAAGDAVPVPLPAGSYSYRLSGEGATGSEGELSLEVGATVGLEIGATGSGVRRLRAIVGVETARL